MMARRKAPILPDALLDQLLAGTDARAALDPGGLVDGLKKALTERALNAEMDHHLDSENEAENRRNGYGAKTVLTDSGKLEIAVPRDRAATFDPQLIAKYQRRFPGFDEKIVSMYARNRVARRLVGPLEFSASGLSSDPGIARASEFEHPVEGGYRDSDLGRLALFGARSQCCADHALVPADRRLDPGSKIIAAGLLPTHPAVLSDGLEVEVPLCRRRLGQRARDRGSSGRHDDRRFGVAGGDSGVDLVLIVGSVAGERGERIGKLVEKRSG